MEPQFIVYLRDCLLSLTMNWLVMETQDQPVPQNLHQLKWPQALFHGANYKWANRIEAIHQMKDDERMILRERHFLNNMLTVCFPHAIIGIAPDYVTF